MSSETLQLLEGLVEGNQQVAEQSYGQLIGPTPGADVPIVGEQFPPEEQPQPQGEGFSFQQFGSSIWEGLQRNFRQIESMPSMLRSLHAELQGNSTLAILHALEAQETEELAPQAQWSLRDIRGGSDFAYWLAERLGENILTLGTAFTGAGLGAAGGNALVRLLGSQRVFRNSELLSMLAVASGRYPTVAGTLSNEVTRRSLARYYGALVGGFGVSAPLETASTAQEQFQVTGSPQPLLSVGAGTVKGMLEQVFPAAVMRALSTPGRQLGRTIPRAIGMSALMEAGTEFTQEAVDVGLRMYSDPNYRMFGPQSGPYEGYNEGMWRLLEAGAAGGLLGGIVGTGSAFVERAQERRRNEDYLRPGEQRLFSGPGFTPPSEAIEPELQQLNGIFNPEPEVEVTPAPSSGVMNMIGPPQGEIRLEPEGIGREETSLAEGKRQYIVDELRSGSSISDVKTDLRGSEIKTQVKQEKQHPTPGGKVQRVSVYVGDEPAGYFEYTLTSSKSKNDTAYMNWVQQAHGRRWSMADLRKLREDFRKIEPTVTIFEGRRISGAKGQKANSWQSVTMNMIRPKVPADPREKAQEKGVQVEGLPEGTTLNVFTDRLGRTNVYVVKGKHALGQYYIRHIAPLNMMQIGRANLEEEVQRKGITTAVHKYLEQRFGMPVVPDYMLSNAEYSRWKKIDPETVKGYIQRGEDWLGDPAQNLDYWVEKGATRYEFGGGTSNMIVPTSVRVQPRAPRPQEPVEPAPVPVDEVDVSGEASGGIAGPADQVRSVIIRPQGQDVDLLQATRPLEQGDLLDLGPLLRSSGIQVPVQELFQELSEARTQRYLIERPDGGYGSTLYNPTDIVFALAEEFTQDVRPKVRAVKAGSLSPVAITADIFDLPHNVESDRIWFLPGTSQAEQTALLGYYRQFIEIVRNNTAQALETATFKSTVKAELQPAYNEMLARGLRVVPSRGASFQYGAAPLASVEVREETIRSGKTKQRGLLKPTGQVVLEGHFTDVAPTGGAIPVSLDLYKFAPGTVSGLPMRIYPGEQEVLTPGLKGVSAGDYLRVNTEMGDITPASGIWDGQSIAEFKERFMKRGIYLNPLEAPFASIVTMDEQVGLSKVVPGDDPTLQNWARGRTERAVLAFSGQTFTPTPVVTIDASVQDIEVAVKMEGILRPLLPALTKILTDMGLPGGLDISVKHIVDSGTMSGVLAAYSYADHAITYYVTPVRNMNLWGQLTDVQLRAEVINALMHEAGHAVTLYFYGKLPVEMKQQIQFAYEKAKISRRTLPTGAEGRFAFTFHDTIQGMHTDANYFTTFIEWLAEQFRRYAYKDTQVVSELDKVYADTSAQLDSYFREWREKIGEAGVVNLFNPDYFFSAFMQYLRDYGKVREQVKQRTRYQNLYAIGEDVYASPQSVFIMEKVEQAMLSMKNLFPVDHPFHIVFGERLDPSKGAVMKEAIARVVPWNDKKLFIEVAVGALQYAEREGRTVEEVRKVFAHELVHVYRKLGLLSTSELNALYQTALKEGKGLDTRTREAYRADLKAQAERGGWSQGELELRWHELLREETVAYYIGEYANTGVASSEVKGLLDRILELLKRVAANFLGVNLRSSEELLHMFFSGEMVSRFQKKSAAARSEAAFMRAVLDPQDIEPTYTKDVGDGVFSMEVEMHYNDVNNNREIAIYQFKNKVTGNVVGVFDVNIEEGRGFTVDMMHLVLPSLYKPLLAEISGDLDLRALLPRFLTEYGMRAANRLSPLISKYYVHVPEFDQYFSPKELRRMRDVSSRVYEAARKRVVEDDSVAKTELRDVLNTKRFWQRYYRKVDKSFWEDPILLQQFFALPRNYDHDEVQGALTREGARSEEAQVEHQLGVAQAPTSRHDSFSMDNVVSVETSAWEQARRMGWIGDEAAPMMPEVRNMRRILSKLDPTGATVDPKYAGYLKKVPTHTLLSQEADRIGLVSRYWLALNQLVLRNEHLQGLVTYKQKVELLHAMTTSWHREADDLARRWETEVPNKTELAGLNDLLFWITNMDYLLPAQKAAGIVRHPTEQELNNEITRRGLSTQTQGILNELYRHPDAIARGEKKDIFARFLDEVEAVSTANIMKTLSMTPTKQAAAIAALQAEMAELRSKPYFPLSRFGRYGITVRDGNPAHNNRVMWFSSYSTPGQRDADLPKVAAKFPGDNVSATRVPEEYFEFMGLPAPLIRMIKNDLPGLTPAQVAWLENFELQHLPDKSFRKRWVDRSGIEGHSMDAFRTFAHYFMHGSRYLARLKYKQDLLLSIESVKEGAKLLPNDSKRTLITDYMVRHYNYIMEGGRDWAKFKAGIAMLQLGFSPAAAFMNLTQSAVSLTWLNGVFGTTRGMPQLLKSLKAVRNLKKGYVTSGYGNYATARDEMVRQGRIDIGQASELGAYSEGNNLLRLMSGTKGQRTWRNFASASMWMFQKAEQVNREVMMHAAWELAQQQMTSNKRIAEVQAKYHFEILDLTTRLSKPGAAFTAQDATAFVLAKEAIDQTQGLYAPYARPAFMRHPVAGSVLIFYQYIHTMMYAFTMNPGAVQLWVVMAMMYGLSGIPGAEDFNEVLRLLSRMLYKDIDPLKEVRRVVRAITRGTIFDEVGPDLFLHGISRYGFGLGLLPEVYGMFRFDASANGSLGKVIPGLYEVVHGMNTASDAQQFTADVTQRLAGAGFGWFFNLLQFGLSSPGSVDGHKWEMALQRQMRALAAAYRYTPPEWGLPRIPGVGLQPSGGATLASGARIARFNATDPGDIASILWQAFGFRPTKVSEASELRRTQIEAERVFMARRGTLLTQWASAQLRRDPLVVQDMVRAITRYNNDVRSDGRPELQISGRQMQQSNRSRELNRQLQERFIAQRRLMRPEFQRLQDLFPGVQPRVQQVR